MEISVNASRRGIFSIRKCCLNVKFQQVVHSRFQTLSVMRGRILLGSVIGIVLEGPKEGACLRLSSWLKLREELSFAAGEKVNGDGPLLVLRKGGAFHVRGFSVRSGVFHLHRSGSSHLETVVHGCAGGKAVGAEACGWISHFQLVDWLTGFVDDVGIDPVALAAGKGEHCRQYDQRGPCRSSVVHKRPSF